MNLSILNDFLTAAGTKSTLNISGVKASLTEAEVNNLMNIIIAKDIFETSAGALVKKADAKLTAKNVTDYTVA